MNWGHDAIIGNKISQQNINIDSRLLLYTNKNHFKINICIF